MSEQTSSQTSWIDDGKALLSSLTNHTDAEPLINSFYDDNNTNSAPINNKIYLKQIEDNLQNNHYQSIDALFDDIGTVFTNALQILPNTQNILPIQQTFVEYKGSYQKRCQQNHPDFNPNNESPEALDLSTEQNRKTRMHSNSNILTPKRRRSARLARLKSNERDSDDNDIDIYIATNVNDTCNKNKRSFSAMMMMSNDMDETNKTNTNTSNKVARTAVDHTSPNVKTHKKRNRNRRPKRRKSTIDMDINNKNDDDDDDVDMDMDMDMDMEQPIMKYNLRSHSKKITPSKSASPSKSKTPIAPKITVKPSLKSTNTGTVIDDHDHVVKESSIEETVINFEDGTQESLCGKFEGITDMKYACTALCISGDFKPFNQDWISLDRFDQFKNENAVIVCGVYDGHGILGHNASKYCARYLPKEFMFALYDMKSNKSQYSNSNSISTGVSMQQSEDNDIEQKQDEDTNEHNMLLALQSALYRIDDELKEISRNESQMFSTILQRQGCESRLIDYGTTVNCLVSDGYDAFIINVGDSRCLLIEGYNDSDNDNKWALRYRQISEDHNPFKRKDEVDRVSLANGQFFKQNADLRLYPKDRTFKEARRKGLAINMTRAVGHSTLCQYGLIADPECYHIKMEHDREYIFVMASDGIWDILDNEQVFESVQSIYTSFVHNQTNETIEEAIAMELLETAERKWRNKRVGDNISVVVTRIVKNH